MAANKMVICKKAAQKNEGVENLILDYYLKVIIFVVELGSTFGLTKGQINDMENIESCLNSCFR